MLKIYLARHGQDKDNAAGVLNGRRDEPLTELGREQARTLAREIKDAHLTFDAVYTSPLQRAEVTARTVTDALGITSPVVMPNLIERDFGVMTGKPVKVLPRSARRISSRPTSSPISSRPKERKRFPILSSEGRK